MGSLEYAQARLSARFGERPDELAWRRIEHVRDLVALIDAARTSAFARWITAIGPTSTPHEIERELRAALSRAGRGGRRVDAGSVAVVDPRGARRSWTCPRSRISRAVAPRCRGCATIRYARPDRARGRRLRRSARRRCARAAVRRVGRARPTRPPVARRVAAAPPHAATRTTVRSSTRWRARSPRIASHCATRRSSTAGRFGARCRRGSRCSFAARCSIRRPRSSSSR